MHLPHRWGFKMSQLKADIEARNLQLSPEDVEGVDTGYDFGSGFPHNLVSGGKVAQGPGPTRCPGLGGIGSF